MTNAGPAARRGRPSSRGEPPRHPEGAATAHKVEAVERALSILSAFTRERPFLTLAELARRTSLNPSTILRLAGSLIRFGYLQRGADGQFRLGSMPLRLGVIYRETFVLGDYVRPVLARLTKETQETSFFHIREGSRRVCLFRHESSASMRHHVEEGDSLPIDRGASAHLLMAYSEEAQTPQYRAIREQGYAISQGERDPETAAVAAPVFGPEGRLIGAMGIAGPVTRLQRSDLQVLAQVVLEAARKLTEELGGPEEIG